MSSAYRVRIESKAIQTNWNFPFLHWILHFRRHIAINHHLNCCVLSFSGEVVSSNKLQWNDRVLSNLQPFNDQNIYLIKDFLLPPSIFRSLSQSKFFLYLFDCWQWPCTCLSNLMSKFVYQTHKEPLFFSYKNKHSIIGISGHKSSSQSFNCYAREWSIQKPTKHHHFIVLAWIVK